MQTLRAIVIALLMISLPLPALASAFGTAHCQMMSTSDGAMDHAHAPVQASAADQPADNDCCCDDCSTCDATCASGGAAIISVPRDARLLGLHPLQPNLIVSRAQAAHPLDLMRPPGQIQS